MTKVKYILQERVALRSWDLVPYGIYFYGERFAKGVSQDEYKVLLQCDGTQELSESEELSHMIQMGYCREAKEGETLTSWQRHRVCQNRYFPALNWTLTGRCNYNCKHCFMAADNEALMDEFSYEQCLDMLDQLEICGIQNVSLTGGEPMLHPRFMDIVRECCKRKIYIRSIVTNASFITKEMLEEFIAMEFYPKFYISFDGLGHHDWLRGVKGSEEKTLSAIALCREMGFWVKAQMNLHRGNLETLMPTVRALDKLGVDDIRIIRTTESPRWTQNAGDLCLSLEEYFEATISLAEQCIKDGIKGMVSVWQLLDFHGTYKSYQLAPVIAGEHVYRDSAPVCRGNRGLIAVTADGDVVPCTQMSGRMKQDGVHLGNVHQQSLQSLISDSDYLKAVTKTVGELAKENEKCRNCKWWKHCAGGCRACAWALTGHQNGSDPTKCLFFHGGYMERFVDLFKKYGYICKSDI